MDSQESTNKYRYDFARYNAMQVKEALGVHTLRSVNLRSANLANAFLEGEDMWGADMSKSNLRGANLSWALLDGANFEGADIRDTNFCKANLRSAINITARMLSQAVIDQETVLPHGMSMDDIQNANQVRGEASGDRRAASRPGSSDRRQGDRRQSDRRHADPSDNN